MNSKSKKNSNGVLIIILVICAIMMFFQCINVPLGSISSYGEWGEFIGGIFGTLIAGIACILVYLTYDSQKKELEKTNETAAIQQFESTFFNLIRIYKESLETIRYTEEYVAVPNTANNYELIGDLENRLREGTLLDFEYRDFISERQVQGEDAMRAAYNSNKTKLNFVSRCYNSTWFNSICMILKYLKDNDKDANSFYAQFFYSQLTKPEWWFLYGIIQSNEIRNYDTERYDNYVALVNDMKLYDNGFNLFVVKQ